MKQSVAETLDRIHTDSIGNGDTRREACILREKIEKLELVFMLELQNRLLNQFHKTGKSLQDP
jgi:hypothetical protein